MFTVVTPSLPTRTLLLAEAIESVAAQTEPATAHLIGIDLDRRGPAYVRNQLIECVRTPWISFLDDDDLFHPHHLQRHRELIESDRGTVDVVFSWAEMFWPNGETKLFDVGFDADTILNRHNMIPVTVSMRTELFRQVGGFDVDSRFEDWALMKKLIRAGARFDGVEEITWSYRVQPGGRNSKMDLD